MKELIIPPPNEKQKEFFESTNRFIGYGGARGGGKSWALRTKFVLLAFQYSGLKLLLLRKTLPELRENHLLPLLSLLNGIARYKRDERAFIFPNGSRIRLGYCDTENDREYEFEKYQDALDRQEFEKEMAFKESEAKRDQANKDRQYALSASRASSSSSSKKSSEKDSGSDSSLTTPPISYNEFCIRTGVHTIMTAKEFGSSKLTNTYATYQDYLAAMYKKYKKGG